jgi:predicted RNase H-like HicB family nuclease
MKYVYPVILSPEEDSGYCVYAPDIPGCVTEADTLIDGIEKIREGLCGILFVYERDGMPVPSPSSFDAIETENGDMITFVDADVGEYRRRVGSKAVRRTISIPEWMDDAATQAGVSLSQITQDALRHTLNL